MYVQQKGSIINEARILNDVKVLIDDIWYIIHGVSLTPILSIMELVSVIIRIRSQFIVAKVIILFKILEHV